MRTDTRSNQQRRAIAEAVVPNPSPKEKLRVRAPTQQSAPGASVTLTKVFLAGPGDFTLTISTPHGVAFFGGQV